MACARSTPEPTKARAAHSAGKSRKKRMVDAKPTVSKNSLRRSNADIRRDSKMDAPKFSFDYQQDSMECDECNDPKDEVDQEAITVLLIDIVANRVMLLRNKIDGSKLTFRQQSLEIHDAHMRRLDDLILANDEMIIEHESNKLIWRTKTVLTDLNRSISNHGIVRTRIRSAFEKISTLSLEIASLKRELASNCPERLNTDMLDLDVVIEATQSKIAEYTIPYDYPIFGDKSSLQELESALVNLKNLEEVETDVLSWTINVDLVNVTEELKLIIRIHELASGNIWWKRKPYVLILEDLEVELPRFSANFHDIVFEIEHEDTVDTSEGIIYYKV